MLQKIMGKKSEAKLSMKFRMVAGAIDAAVNGEYDDKKLNKITKDFLDHLEKVHQWQVVPKQKKSFSKNQKGENT
jgi:hypothetical protein